MLPNRFISFRLNMSSEPITENSMRTLISNTFYLFNASFYNADHNAFQKHLKRKSVPRNTLNKCLLLGFQYVQKNTGTLFEVTPTLKLLLKNGAKWKDDTFLQYEMTPYHIICCCTGDHYEILDLMIASSPHLLIDSRDSSGTTALMYCVPTENINCMKSLITNGADVNVENDSYYFSDNSLTWETSCPIFDTMNGLLPDSKHSSIIMTEIFDLLLDSGIDVNKTYGKHPRTPIMFAMSLGNVACSKKLFKSGVQLENTIWPHSWLWLLAASMGSVELLKCIVDYGIDKNATDENGRNALHFAVDSGNVNVIRFLLDLGVTKSTYTPKVEAVEPCSQCGSNRLFLGDDNDQQEFDVYMIAVKQHKPDVVQLLEEHGCQNGKYFTALRLAMFSNNVEMLEYLFNNYQYPVNIEYSANEIPWGTHQTLLIEACYVSSAKVIKVLLDHGADANRLCGEDCSSVINTAIAYKHVEGVAHIIRSGVDVNLRSYDAQHGYVLPFEVAVKHGNLYAAEMLLIFGCSRGMYRSKNHHEYKTNISQEFNTLLSEWDLLEDKVQPLKEQCRRAILRHLTPQTEKKIINLSLPPILTKFLSIPELENIIEDYGKSE